MAVYSNGNNLIIGLGGTGGKVLKELRKKMYDEGLLRTDGHHQLPIAFMYIDSTDELMHHDDPSWLTLDGHNAQFSHSEFLYINFSALQQIAGAPAAFPHVKEIIGKSQVLETYRPGCGAMQNRRLGRIMFAANAQHFYNMLQEKGHELSMITGHDGPQNIFIVTGLAGGTGSGIVVDVIAQIHKRYPYADIFVMAALPTIPFPYAHEQNLSLANFYAALKELNALNVGAFKPLDIMTSGQRVETNSQETLQFTLIPFEDGSIADSLYRFLTIISQGGEYAEYFYRTVSYYAPGGRGHWLQWEYSTIEIGKPVRTQALVSYAQKTIMHPKNMILQRISFSMLAQFMRQMDFNNYYDNIGYAREAQHTYAYYRMVVNHQRERWCIDHESLTLQRPFPFIPHDSCYSFQVEWERMADYFFRDAAVLESSREERFNLLGELYKEYYYTRYRNYGVKSYFKEKVSALNNYAQEIYQLILQDLFMRWHQGEFGIFDLIEIVKILIDFLRDKNENAEKRIIEYNELSVKCREEMEFIRMDFAHLNMFRRAFRAKQYLQRYNERLKECYISLTYIHAIEFERHLLYNLINRLLEQENRLMTISSKLAEMENEANCIAEKIRKESEEHHDTHNPMVDLSNEDAIECCINKLVADRNEMKRLSTILRQKIAERYDDFRQLEYLDKKQLPYLAKMQGREIETNIMNMGAWLGGSFYNPLYEDTFAALLHRNVSNREQVHQFVYECINGLGVPLQLKEAELIKVVPHNSYPDPSLGNTMVFVSLSKPKTGEEERLSHELENAFRAASHNIYVSTAESRDEITIISLRTKFPIRAINILPELKASYDSYIAENTDKALGILHTEDSCHDLPLLEVERCAQTHPELMNLDNSS